MYRQGIEYQRNEKQRQGILEDQCTLITWENYVIQSQLIMANATYLLAVMSLHFAVAIVIAMCVMVRTAITLARTMARLSIAMNAIVRN